MIEATTPYDSGLTLWSPGTIKFAILHWQAPHHVIGYACAPNATQLRKFPPTFPLFSYAEIRLWQAHGAPLKRVAICLATPRGWHWTRYHGNISWAKKNYRPFATNTSKGFQP